MNDIFKLRNSDRLRASHWEGGHGSTTSISEANKQTNKDPTVSVLNIRDIAFYVCSEIIRTRNFKIFTVCALIFREFMAVFPFF